MPLTTAALDLMNDALGSAADSVSLHSADPGATGANETTAARQVPVFSVSAGGVMSLSAAENFTGGAASGAATFAGLWQGATFLGGFPITTGDTSFNAAGEFTLNDLDITGTSP